MKYTVDYEPETCVTMYKMDKTWTTYERYNLIYLLELQVCVYRNLYNNLCYFIYRYTQKYRDGVRRFIDDARKHARNQEKIICPCAKCKNLSSKTHEELYEDLIINGFDPLYKVWVLHGEPSTSVNESIDTSKAYRMFQDSYVGNENQPDYSERRDRPDFRKTYEQAELPLYSTCKSHTKFSATMALYNHKAENGLSDKGFDELLQIIRSLLPTDNTLPDSLNTVKSFLKEFNLGYEKIDACVNDCCLFRKEYEHLENCPKCETSRWKLTSSNEPQGGVSAKVLRYFPIIPRLRRMFSLAETSRQLRWHYSHRSDDGKMRHPADSLAWNTIDKKWPEFAYEPRNLRFGLATDGFNPFKGLNTTYSCWPVILCIYNLPPEVCMSYENLMLSLLIPGPNQPGNNIDIYLQPLIDDLKELWMTGVDVFDAETNKEFNLKAVLIWTIHDFPAYGNVCGCTTKGEFACPVCAIDTSSVWLNHSIKTAYMCHRRLLTRNHKFNNKATSFDGTKEDRRPTIQ